MLIQLIKNLLIQEHLQDLRNDLVKLVLNLFWNLYLHLYQIHGELQIFQI